MRSYVLGFLFSHNCVRVVLIRKKRRMHVGMLNGLGGQIEPGETPEQAMAREFADESGSSASYPWVMFGVLSDPEWRVYLFRARKTFIPTNWRDGEEGQVEVHLVDDVLGGASGGFLTVPDLPYLVQAAIVSLEEASGGKLLRIEKFDCLRDLLGAKDAISVPPFGTVVRRMRESLGFSVGQLSEVTGGSVSANLIEAVESDAVDPRNFEEEWFGGVLLLLSCALGVAPSVLGDLCRAGGRRETAELLRVLAVSRGGGSP